MQNTSIQNVDLLLYLETAILDASYSLGLGVAKFSHRARPSSSASMRDVQQNWALPNNILLNGKIYRKAHKLEQSLEDASKLTHFCDFELFLVAIIPPIAPLMIPPITRITAIIIN
jgi:hypothetical protein